MSLPPHPEQAGLLAAVSRGEPDAIDTWFRAEHPLVYRLCAGFLADATEAEDVAQDAMLKLIDQMPRYDARRSWNAWRNTIVLNLCRDRMRRLASRRCAESAEPLLAHSSPLPSPEQAAHAGEAREILMACLAALSPREREAFVLHDLQGGSTADTAAALGVGQSSVRSLLTLARRRLRALIGERVPELAPGGGRDDG
jgi:RNA polymerase sigma-70 factor (ECF subfamily)